MNIKHAANDIRLTLNQAKLCEQVWWLLLGPNSDRDRIVRSFNLYFDFFNTVRPGMYVTFIVRLASLFDKDTRSVSLKSIPEIRADPAFPALWEKGQKLYRYRSKAIAHRDFKNEKKDFAYATGFSLNELRDILAETCAIYDRYALAQGIEGVPRHSADRDLLRLVRRLTR